MTYSTNTSDNITIHFFNPAWAKPSEYIQTTTKPNKNQENTKECVKHVTKKIPNSKLVQNLTKPTTASTLHSMNGAWVPTPEQLGVSYEIYRRRRISIEDAVNYKKPKFIKLKNEKEQERIVQRLCRPTFSSSMHENKKNEKFVMISVVEAVKDIDDKMQRKIPVVNVGFPPVKPTESQTMRSFNPWIDESSLDIMKTDDKSDGKNQGINNNIKKKGQIDNTRTGKSVKKRKRSGKININKIQECKKNKAINISRQLNPKLKEEINCNSEDSKENSKPLNELINVNLDIPLQASDKAMVPVKVKLINMDHSFHMKYKRKIAQYENILNSMLVESLEKFEFSFEKEQRI